MGNLTFREAGELAAYDTWYYGPIVLCSMTMTMKSEIEICVDRGLPRRSLNHESNAGHLDVCGSVGGLGV